MSWNNWLARVVMAAALFVAFWSPDASAQGRWLRAESPHFIVYADGNEAQLRDAVQRLEAFDATLRHLLAPPDDDNVRKLEVYLFRTQENLSDAMGVNNAFGIGGFYSASPGFVGAIALQNFGRPDLRAFAGEVLFHEYAHHFMLSHYSAAYPAWFVEGFAEFVGTTEITDTEVRVGAASRFRDGILNYDWPRAERFLNPGERGSVVGIYGVGWLATHYLINTPERMQGFGRYLTAFQSGEDPVESFQPAFGISFEEFQAELRRYRGRGLGGFVFPRVPTADGDIIVTRLPEAADDLLPYTVQLRRTDPDEISDRESDGDRARRIRNLITDTTRIGARHPNDPYAVRAVARAELLRNNASTARALLEPVLAANPDDVEALYLMGLSYITEARAGDPASFTTTAAQGRRYFARVFRIDPQHVPTLYRYSETYWEEPGPMPDARLDVLTQAHLLAPQAMRIRVRLGMELMEAGDFDHAVPVLAPAAYSPHRYPLTRQARVLLEAAQRNEMPTAAALAAAEEEPEDED